MWHYNGEDDASRCGRKGLDTPAALAKTLAELFKGEEKEFLRIKFRDGYSMYNPPSRVRPDTSVFTPSISGLPLINFLTLFAYDNTGEKSPRDFIVPPHSRRTTTGSLIPSLKRIQIYFWCSRRGCFTRRAMMVRKWPSLPIILVFFLLHR